MTQDELNDFVADEIIKLRDENKALKKQLKSFDNAEELLAKLTIASDQAKSLHDSMMVSASIQRSRVFRIASYVKSKMRL